MQRTIKILILLLTMLTYNTAQAKRPALVWLEINDATAFEEEFVRKSLNKMGWRIVESKRDKNFGFDKGVSYDGGVKIRFTDQEGATCFATRATASYNLDNEQIRIMSVTINRWCLNLFDEINRYYAFRNAVNHEWFCHAVTQKREHTDWGLCRPSLSTHKVIWGKRNRKYVRKNLNPPGRTGEVLPMIVTEQVEGRTVFRKTYENEETLCELTLEDIKVGE